MEIEKWLNELTIEEKIALTCGADFWHTVSLKGIPAMTMADGPNGLRYQELKGDMLGINDAVPTTCFPTSSASALSWDRALLEEIGAAISQEAIAYNVDAILGPGLNIKRSPLCGRNFEYYSEDPYLSGQLGAAFVKGVQSKGVGACVKHFAANSQEYKRFSSNDHIDERTLREIYLPAFEQAIKEAKPQMVMCAYNKVNGTYCSDNKWLLTDVLRDEWGFDGMVVTDWGAMHDRVLAIKAGCDLSMPGGTAHLQKHALEAYQKGELTQAEIDLCVSRILKKVLESKSAQKAYDREAHHLLAKKAAVKGAVLLKNEGVLPLKTSKVALIGYMAQAPRYQGTGSSHINPTKLLSLTQVAPEWDYAPGYDALGNTDEELLAKAAKAARNADVAVVVAGLPDHYESEGFDRDNMRMPEGHCHLIETVAKANPNTVVVLLCGSPVEVPWIDKVKVVLYMGLPGQAGAEAIYDLLCGKENPCGRLSETWPLKGEDAPCAGYYGTPNRDAQYREGIYVGYRYYDSAKVPVRFPFGFGLSYTHFEYADLQLDGLTVSAMVTNTGAVAGSEILQLYIAPPKGRLHRPVKELKGFETVFLYPGESKRVTFELNDRSFALWADGWRVQEGEYKIQLGNLVGGIYMQDEILNAPAWQKGSWYENLTGQPGKQDFEKLLGHEVPESTPPKKGQYTIENTIVEMAEHSLVMRLMKIIMGRVIAKMNGGKVGNTNTAYRMAYASSVDSALFSLIICSGGSMPENIALGLLDMANGRYLKGIGKMLRK